MNTIFASLEQIANKTSQFCRRINYSQKVAFMHIPKCAGSSIMESLRQNNKASWAGHVDGPQTRANYMYYYLENQLPISGLECEQEIYKFRQTLLIDRFQKKYPIISGHVPFIHSLKYTYSDYLFFTIVRPPIDRFLSAFNFCLKIGKLEPINLEIVKKKGIDYAFDAYLDSEKAIIEGNLLIQFLGECGKESINFNDLEKKAYTGLNNFDYIGTTENIDLLEKQLKSRKVISDKIKKTNVTNKSLTQNTAIKTKNNLTNYQKGEIEKKCKMDIQLYNHISGKIIPNFKKE